jgi:hypothetical protein
MKPLAKGLSRCSVVRRRPTFGLRDVWCAPVHVAPAIRQATLRRILAETSVPVGVRAGHGGAGEGLQDHRLPSKGHSEAMG